MIKTKKELFEIVKSAYEAVSIYEGAPRQIVPTRFATDKAQAAQSFAESVTEKKLGKSIGIHSCMEVPPKEGYASWLLRLPEPAIMIYKHQVREWHKSAGGSDNVPHPDVQHARLILHEVGHIITCPDLLSREGPNWYAVGCTPEEEEAAWVWTFIVYGLALGDYARSCREGGRDDTVTIAI